jgi:hypothetical protein
VEGFNNLNVDEKNNYQFSAQSGSIKNKIMNGKTVEYLKEQCQHSIQGNVNIMNKLKYQ